jgi:protein phosphatase
MPRNAFHDDADRRPFSLSRVDVAAGTDTGKVRESNQDQYVVVDIGRTAGVRHASYATPDPAVDDPRALLLVVADGMGGFAGGGVASAVAAQVVVQWARIKIVDLFKGEGTADLDLVSEALAQSVMLASEAIKKAAQRTGLDPRMGTTLTMALVAPPEVLIAHAGDSRCYLGRRGVLGRMTLDHTYAELLVASGQATVEDVDETPLENVLVNAVGGLEGTTRVELRRATLEPGDAILLCSDGLIRHVEDPAISAELARGGPARERVSSLIEAAIEGGGSDNVTVVLARF